MTGKEVGRFREVAGMPIIAAGGLGLTVDTFNCRQPSGLNELTKISFLGGGGLPTMISLVAVEMVVLT